MQLGHDNLSRRDLLTVNIHRINGNAAAVVNYGDGIINVDGDINVFCVAGERLINRVVHNFIDQVMQAHVASRADVHSRALAHRFHATQHFNRIGGVVIRAAAVVAAALYSVRGSLWFGGFRHCGTCLRRF